MVPRKPMVSMLFQKPLVIFTKKVSLFVKMDLIRTRMGTQFLKISKSRTGVKSRNYSKSFSNQKKPVGVPTGLSFLYQVRIKESFLISQEWKSDQSFPSLNQVLLQVTLPLVLLQYTKAPTMVSYFLCLIMLQTCKEQ